MRPRRRGQVCFNCNEWPISWPICWDCLRAALVPLILAELVHLAFRYFGA